MSIQQANATSKHLEQSHVQYSINSAQISLWERRTQVQIPFQLNSFLGTTSPVQKLVYDCPSLLSILSVAPSNSFVRHRQYVTSTRNTYLPTEAIQNHEKKADLFLEVKSPPQAYQHLTDIYYEHRLVRRAPPAGGVSQLRLRHDLNKCSGTHLDADYWHNQSLSLRVCIRKVRPGWKCV